MGLWVQPAYGGSGASILGTARAEAGSAVSLREVPGFSHVMHEGEPVKLRLTRSHPTRFLSSNRFFFSFQRQVLLQTV